MLPKEPYRVGGCTTRLTQTTENRRRTLKSGAFKSSPSQSSQGRVGPTTTSVLANLRRYVGATSLLPCVLRQHRRQLVSKRNTSMPCACERCRPTGLYRTYEQPTTVIRISSTQLCYHRAREAETHPPLPQDNNVSEAYRCLRNGAFIPSHEWRRDFPHQFVNFCSSDPCGRPVRP